MKELKIIWAVFLGLISFWYFVGAFVAASFDISLWNIREGIALCFVMSFGTLCPICIVVSNQRNTK